MVDEEVATAEAVAEAEEEAITTEVVVMAVAVRETRAGKYS